MENLTAPFKVTVGDIAIMTPRDYVSVRPVFFDPAQLTRLCLKWATHGQLQSQDRITISVANTIAATIESPNVILCGRGTGKVACCRRSSWHLGGLIGIQGLSRGYCRLGISRMSTDMSSGRGWLGV